MTLAVYLEDVLEDLGRRGGSCGLFHNTGGWCKAGSCLSGWKWEEQNLKLESGPVRDMEIA